MECQQQTNIKDCRCTYTSCSRRGSCCACVRYHRDKDEVPACFFSATAEKTYDRSFDNLIRDRQSSQLRTLSRDIELSQMTTRLRPSLLA